MSTHAAPPSGGKGFKGIIIGAVMVFFFIILVKFFFFTGNDKQENNALKEQQKEQQANQSLVERINVHYGSSYGQIYYLPSGYDFNLRGATEPYCYTNGNHEEAYGEIGEDASGTFGNNPANKKLRFKSQNGRTGELIIVLTKQRTIY